MIKEMTLRAAEATRQRGACCALPQIDPAWAEARSSLMKALADPTRLTMVATLWQASEPVCICDFTASLDLSQPTISHHMAKLKEAGLVESEKKGIWMYYRLRDDLPGPTRQILRHLLA